jgi:NAD(P)-dependent dehydrogenase (short-subunit alcohol dehydrogenase family)
MAGRVMLVAGGSGSIGGAIAAAALAEGWRVAVHGRTDRSAARATAAFGASGETVRALAGDMAGPDAAARLVAEAGAWHGRLDAVIDCVAAGPAARIAGAFADSEAHAYPAFLDQSLGHIQRLARAALPWLTREGGTLVAFASDAALFARAGQSLVGASRAGIVGFVRNLAMEVARDGVRVHCICPGFVDESRIARRLEDRAADRLARARERAGLGLPTPADVAPAVLFLCGEGARRITGQAISINGGLNC